jgi:hypothetical protein
VGARVEGRLQSGRQEDGRVSRLRRRTKLVGPEPERIRTSGDEMSAESLSDGGIGVSFVLRPVPRCGCINDVGLLRFFRADLAAAEEAAAGAGINAEEGQRPSDEDAEVSLERTFCRWCDIDTLALADRA